MFHVTIFAWLFCTVLSCVYHDANVSDPHVLHAYLQDDITALHVASEEGHKAIVKLLLEAGADVNVTNDVSTLFCGVGQAQECTSGMTAASALCCALLCLAVSMLWTVPPLCGPV